MRVLITVAISFAFAANAFAQIEIPINIKQLSLSGSMPAELRCEKLLTDKANILKPFSCVLGNNTKKKIIASVVTYEVITEINGRETSDFIHTNTVNSFIHSDLIEKIPPVEPNQAMYISSPGDTIYSEDVKVKRIEMSLDYVEFSDGVTLGASAKGVRMIADTREGAAKFRDWLVKEYAKQGRNEKEILPLLEEQTPFSSELVFANKRQEFGAKTYRRRALEILKKNGAGSLDKMWNKLP